MPPKYFGPLKPWTNQDLLLYHGTTIPSALSIYKDGIDLTAGREEVDFGPGFYTTTNLRQAHDWAQKKAKGASPAVLEFHVGRNQLAKLDTLWFVRYLPDAEDFWSLIGMCRDGIPDHARPGSYDIVTGPVSDSSILGRSVRIGYDQVSFHTDRSLQVLIPGQILEVS